MSPAPLRDAATVVLLRRDGAVPRVLMGERGSRAAFMPSKVVFPGGAVEAADADVPLAAPLSDPCAARLAVDSSRTPHALAAAAIRELWEETGLVLGRADAWDAPPPGWQRFAETGHRPDASGLRFFFRARTPAVLPRRFDARFFLADAAGLASDPDDFSRALPELGQLAWVPLDRAGGLDLPEVTRRALEAAAAALAAGPLRAPDWVPFYRHGEAAPADRIGGAP